MLYKTLAAIVGITVIELVGLYLGVNGVGLSLSVAALAGLGGYEINKPPTTVQEAK